MDEDDKTRRESKEKKNIKNELIHGWMELRRRVVEAGTLKFRPAQEKTTGSFSPGIAGKALMTINEPISILDRNLRVIWVNGAWENMHQQCLQEMMSQPFCMMFHGVNEICDWCSVIETFHTGKPAKCENSFFLPDGKKVWKECHTWPIRNEQGQFDHMVVYVEDITPYKQTEEALRESEKKYRRLVETLSEGIWVIDENHYTTFVNRNMARMLGYSVEEMQGKHVLFFIDEDETETYKYYLERGKQGIRDQIDFNFIRKDGKKVYVRLHASPIIDEQGKYKGCIALVSDMTKHRRSQQLLRESEAKYATLVEQAMDSVTIVQEGVLQFANRATAQMIGYRLEELKGKPFLDLVAPEFRESLAHIYQQYMAGQKVPSWLEAKFVCRDGTIKDGEISLGFIEYHGEPALMAITRDVTERKRQEAEKEVMQAQLLHSQKMEAIGQLAGGIAHDFNNILTVINGYAGMAMIKLDETNPLANNMKEIGLAAERASHLTRQLLLFSREKHTKSTRINLNKTIDGLLKMLYRLIGENITIIKNLEPNLWPVLADEGNIEQVIVNLVVNARDAMPKGGQITIKTENRTLEEKQTRIMPEARPGQYICLSVSDTGCGMEKRIIDRIFEPFFTTKEIGKGSGLGLSIIYAIIKQHHGWVTVSSEPGHGTTFFIYLSAFFRRTEEEAKEAIGTKELRGKGERVLVVEDEEAVRKVTARALREHGYMVYETFNVKEAVAIFKQEKGDFHLIISDIVLPDKTGLQLAGQLLAQNSQLRFLLISGYPNQNTQLAAINERGFQYLQKPFDVSDLLQAVKKSL